MIVGIDLGTTHSLIGVYKDGEAQLIPNPLGELLTPSVISLLEDGSLVVGAIAKERLHTHPNQTASLFKRVMGTQKKINLGKKAYLPEELSAMVLKSLINDAEAFLNEKVTEAVISVPAYFSNAQREATKRAGILAGIKVERLINEPTAAALAYGLREGEDKDTFLIVDLGGGTLDVSLLEVFDGIFEVHASAGDNYLGGEDFTKAILSAFCDQFSLKPSHLSQEDYSALFFKMESLKKRLSFVEEESITVTLSGENYDWKMNRDQMEQYCAELLQRVKAPIERAIRDANISPSMLDQVVLVGGSTRMHAISTLIQRMFKLFPLKNIHPDETIAIGATIAAGLKDHDEALKDIVLTDVTPYSLGIETSKLNEITGNYDTGYFSPIISRNQTLPISRVEIYNPIHKNQKKLQVNVYQGESVFVKDNIRLGSLSVDLPSLSTEDRSISVRFTYDINGILEVETTVNATKLTKRMYISTDAENSVSEKEMEVSIKKLESLKIHPAEEQENLIIIARADKCYQEYINDRNMIQDYLSQFKTALETQDRELISESREKFKSFLDELESW